ncbi:hypothetical protein CAV24_14620, partial [Listeria monocytogenes]|nr:hypothetical protein [Listeria monocytogenes]
FLCFSSIFVTATTSGGLLANVSLFVTGSLFVFTLVAVVGLFIFNIVRGIQMLCEKTEEDIWI